MKKYLSLLIIAISALFLLQAHSYNVLNYQGVLKNPDGSIRPNTQTTVQLDFIQDGNIVYSESHNITTNPNGYFAIHPGEGESIIGTFSEIDWGYSAISMRSIIDGNIIAETRMTSVPYALYSLQWSGENATRQSIDSVGDAHHETALQVDEIIQSIDYIQQEIDTTNIRIDSIHSILDSTYCIIDSIQLSILQLYENDSITSQKIDRLQDKTDSLSTSALFFNATAQAPLLQGEYHTKTSATQAVPQHIRKNGLIVTYRSDTLNWHSIQFNNNDTAQWNRVEAWKEYGSYGNITLPYNTSDSLTRLQVPQEHRRQGLIISYYNNTEIINEQYFGVEYDNTSWSNSNSWMRLLFTNKELDKLKSEIARIDTLVNDVKKGLQDMSTFGAWFYINHNEQFSQAGAIDYSGTEVANIAMVHTPLIPIEETWFVTIYGNNQYPGITFFSDNDYNTRIPFQGDTLTSDKWQQQTIDFSTDEIPYTARYFALNMPLEKKGSIELKKRMPIENVIDTSIKYAYQEQINCFNYIGAYVGCNGKRTINSQCRHTKFFEIGDNVYKVNSIGSYNDQNIIPIIVYYSDASFNNAVSYDIGDVGSDGMTSREIIISKETAPTDAEYFIINCIPTAGQATISMGKTTEYAINTADTRITSLENNISCYSGRKLVTLGDSFTTNSGNRNQAWQQWLCDWLGVSWSQEETLNGVNGYCAMGVGGSWVIPNNISSMSIRCLDIRRYSPNLIIIYGGQNDQIDKYELGTIDDKPFMPSQIVDLVNRSTITSLQEAIDYFVTNNITPKAQTVIHVNTYTLGRQLYYLENPDEWTDTTSWIRPIEFVSFYSAYKGMLEQVSTQNPFASIYCVTLMQCDSTRYDQSLGDWDELDKQRRRKCEAIKEIAAYYGVQVIDAWNTSGITPYNASSLYNDWLHPNQYGYRRLAECIYRAIK